MQMTGSQLLPVPREETWRALNDPQQLKAALAGCEKFELQDDGRYAVVMIASVGPVKAKFNSTVAISDAQAPERYTLTFDGQGGVAGFGRGTATVELLEEPGDQTRLNYSVSAQVGGKLAQIGQRLIDAAAKKMSDDFFARFSTALAGAVSQPPSQLEELSIREQDRTNFDSTTSPNSLSTRDKTAASKWPIVVSALLIVALLLLGAVGGKL
jgi:uncharacterized protein